MVDPSKCTGQGGQANASTDQMLDALMPMNLRVDSQGTIQHAGPTLLKVRPVQEIVGRKLLDLFEFKHPRIAKPSELMALVSPTPLRMSLRETPKTAMRGLAVKSAEGGDLIINLSFGFSVLEAIRQYELHSTDFATTDPTLEMLYLIEAKSSAMEESRDLNMRLQGAKIAAEEQAFTDTLTGLKNRRALEHIMRRYCDQGVTFTLLGVDLDFFKSVNDTLGHAAGDHVLQRVARILVDSTRPGDTLVRNGGDEFLIILKDQDNLEVARVIAERLIKRIEEPIMFEDEECTISASIGVSSVVLHDEVNMEQMLLEVDTALYHSKRQGRSRVTMFEVGMELASHREQSAGSRLEARGG